MHKYRVLLLFIVGSLAISLPGLAQDDEFPNLEKSKMVARMQNGAKLMEAGDYEAADSEFKYVLKNADKLPSDISYYFGANSFYMGKYRQSISWLNKYLELQGSTGRFSAKASELLDMAEDAYRNRDAVVEVTELDEEESTEIVNELNAEPIDCGEDGIIRCPVCHGKGVIIRKTAFDYEYKTCPFSDKNGNMTCEDYNALLRGELNPQQEQ